MKINKILLIFILIPQMIFAQKNILKKTKINKSAVSDSKGVNVEKTKLSESLKEEKSAFSFSYFNFSSSDAAIANYTTPSWTMYQYLSLGYKLDDQRKIAIQFPFMFQTTGAFDSYGNQRTFANFPADIYGTYANSKLISWGDENKISSTFYIYAPTTEFSQNKMWALRTAAKFSYDLPTTTKFKLGFTLKPDYYWLTQKSYRNEKTKYKGYGESYMDVYPDANMLAKMDDFFSITYELFESFKPQAEIGFVQEWYADSQWTSNNLNADRFRLSPSFYIKAAQSLSFIVGAENKIDVRSPKKDFALFREEETSYFVITMWTLL